MILAVQLQKCSGEGVKQRKCIEKLEFEKGSRDHNKSKRTNNQLEPVTRDNSAPSCIGYCYSSKPNACTNKAFSNTSIRFNPYFG